MIEIKTAATLSATATFVSALLATSFNLFTKNKGGYKRYGPK